MITIPRNESMKRMSKSIVFNSKKGVWDGKDHTEYFHSCKFYLEEYEALIIFTRDMGHHSCGWWKNPDFERCYHFSISFVDKFGNEKPKNQKKTEKLLDYFFGKNKRMIWSEPPYSEVGIKKDVWHYRLFCDENWIGIMPRGEVYSKKFTEAGWKSYSELNNK